ncbi:MAG: sugar phosphate isomerase/epimerase family protein [Planctomycetaceae bacterium]
MHEIAFSTLSCPDWSWREILEHGPRMGYDGVEIRLLERDTDLLARPEFQSSALTERRRELREAGFRICGLASSVRFDDVDERLRAMQLESGRRHVELAAELGAGFVRVFGDTLPDESETAARIAAFDRIAAGLNELGEHAGSAGVEILIETHGDFCASPAMAALCERMEHPAVGVLWDTHHPWRFHEEDPAATFARIGRFVRHTHWKDSVTRAALEPTDARASAAEEFARSLMPGHRHADYVPFGEGEFPAEECVAPLLTAGYTGWFCLEWEKMWHPEIAGPEIALPPFPEAMRRLLEAASRSR